jgi:polyisoprenoid-binding protein YceI
VRFDATAPNSPEKIEAVAKSNSCIMDQNTGNLEIAVLLKGFQFERALMQEHFNENYLESSRYPKALFRGKIDNLSTVNFAKDGTYKTTVTGTMTLHGTIKNMSAPVVFVVKSGKLTSTSDFSLTLSDYNISIPNLVSDKINKSATIKVEAALEKLN